MIRALTGLSTPGGAWLAAVGVACGMALLAALVLQFGFGFEPCNLCLWERWPYLVAAAAALGGLIVDTPRVGLAAVTVFLLGGTLLAAYHVGVEQGLFALPEGCASAGKAASIEELRQMLTDAPPRCDQVNAAFLGLSLATWNLMLSAFLSLTAAFGFAWTRPVRS
ncbi:MAG TPA: disulfide bond formation protein B [Geminicoccaceae bacterium]|nr:disulfide bond formation protein B [Geminicoccus sp.]HMU48866.1 disulfide bond formation protein B [Geminicoccaceae bacterium]